ncbi:MAG: hypothetical protein PHY85_03590 [Bacteroidales bacterium]|nr:hypothetical protein [Bacteroidales bacterium]
METEKQESDLVYTNNDVKKENKFKKFLFKHKYYLGLILIIIVVVLWALIKISILKSSFNKEKSQIITNYELKLDSLNSNRFLLTAKTFSWAIRSELLRENKDQVNQFFNDFIKNTDVIKLQLINPETSIVEISTDKKDEGVKMPINTAIEDQVVNVNPTDFQIITPISGLNNQIGIFVMKIKKLNHEQE